jgi:carbonic anhydrase
MSEVRDPSELPIEPAKGLAILTCMDVRIDPRELLGLNLGDAHVIRNAGGLVTDDVMRSLLLSQSLLGTREVYVIQHTGCGLNSGEDSLRARVAEAAGSEPPWPLGAFEDVERSVAEQLEILRTTPHLLEGRLYRGFVYDVGTGELREVV